MNTKSEIPVLAILRHRWKSIASISAASFICAAVVVFTMPKRYESQMMLLVKNERQPLVVSPDNNSNAIAPSEPDEDMVNSEIALIQSSDVLKDVVLKRNLAVGQPGTVMAADGKTTPLNVENALSTLRKNLSITPIKKSDVIKIAYSALSPSIAAGVLNQLSDTYLEAHLRAHDTPGMYSFFQTQTASYEQRLASDEANLTDFRQRYSMLALPEEGEVVPKRAVDAEAEYEDTQVAISQDERKILNLEHQLAGLQPRVMTQQQSGVNQSLVQRYGGTLLELENQRTDLVRKFRPDDRLVRDLDRQIDQTRAALHQAEQMGITEKSTDINQLHQATKRDLIMAEAELSGLMARKRELSALVGVYKGKLYDMAGATVRYAELMRQYNADQQNYLLYAKKREEARIAASLDRERIANVAVVETPTVPVKPSSPHIRLDLAISLLLSICLGVCGAILMEFLGIFGSSQTRPLTFARAAVGD